MTTKELIDQYVTAHADNRWMDASELEALLTEFAEKLIELQPKSREERFREYLQSSSAKRRKFDLSFLDETRKEALAVLTDLGYECKLPQESASEELELAAIDYDSCRPALYGEDDDGDMVEYIEVRKDAFMAGAEWQKEQIMKDDKFLIAIGDAYVDWIDGGINTNDEDSADYIRKNMRYKRQ